MAIPEERRKWIVQVASGARLDGMPKEELEALTDADFDRLSREFFDSITDPEELHLYADEFDWDVGIGDIGRVVEHPLCDLGTALLVYWRARPGFYLQYRNREAVPEYDHPFWDLIRDIEERVSRGQYRSAELPFDPADDHRADLRPDPKEVRAYGRNLPAVMYRAVGPGRERKGAG